MINLIKMIIVIICIFFTVGMLLANQNSAQTSKIPKLDTPVKIIATTPIQEILLDSNARQEKLKARLKFVKDSLNNKIVENRKRVIEGFHEIIEAAKQPKVIKDTIIIPLIIDTTKINYNYLPLTINHHY